ncbi:m7GpppX diphosphatase [Cylas formicarius]|uniref:m7GpppX diphosphatase n=1 Tax=Cylas formicarius TaxID=197179 RepID=UPI00295872B7|nr:m7GpppX diphosphatase [Cylas formicarius]
MSLESQGIQSKKPKLNLNLHENIKDLSEFKLGSVLQNSTNRKVVCLRGSFQSKEGEAVVILEKTAFSVDDLTSDSKFFCEKNQLEKIFHNDVYGDYKYFPIQELNSIKATIIHPATEKHIAKYSSQTFYIIEETPDIYFEIVLPHITDQKFDLQWVYNILEHKSESDRILVEDTDPNNGFVMVPDLKWNGEIDTLYFLAIIKKINIKSIRDLTSDHLPLLKNIRDKGIAAIKNKYGLESSDLRIYFHYQPSFYHLHVHFTYLRHEAPGILTERAHLLTTVINNIELLSDYYQRSTIPFVVRENDKWFDKFVEKGIVKRRNGI